MTAGASRRRSRRLTSAASHSLAGSPLSAAGGRDADDFGAAQDAFLYEKIAADRFRPVCHGAQAQAAPAHRRLGHAPAIVRNREPDSAFGFLQRDLDLPGSAMSNGIANRLLGDAIEMRRGRWRADQDRN